MPYDYADLAREQLIELLKRRDSERRLGLIWERNEIEHDRSINADFVALEEIPGISVGAGPHRNIVVEADNFDALRWLRMTHRSAIKFIYIDPPYNTRNRSFVYNDDYVDPEDRYLHSKWLEFMYQRLLLARDLLAPDGLIFVSIDDGEASRLRLLMDTIFPGGFQLSFVWQSEGNTDNAAKFKAVHEYILVYARDKDSIVYPPTVDPNIEEDSKLFNAEKRNTITKNGKKNPKSQLVLPPGFPTNFDSGIIRARTDKWPHVLNDARVQAHRLVDELTLFSGWSSANLCRAFIETEFNAVLDDRNQPTSFELTRNGVVELFKPRTAQSHVISVLKNLGTTNQARSRLEKLGIVFEYPKPVNLIKYLLRMLPQRDFTALDFFAGTGTTGEALMRLNAEDGGKRNFILVSSTEATKDEPDKNIARDACAKRMSAYFSEDGRNVSASNLYGFKYFRALREPFGDLDLAFSAERAWITIQASHGVAIARYDTSAPAQSFVVEDVTVVFVDRASRASIDAAVAAIYGKRAILYSWAPGRFRDALVNEDVEMRQLPAIFTERFRR